MSKRQKIFLVKYRAIGDTIMGLGGVRYLRSLFPDADISYGVPDWIAPLFDEVHIDADQVVPLSFASFGDWWRSFKKLRALRPDVIFEMHQGGRSQKFFRLYRSLTGTPYHFHNHHLKSFTGVVDQGVSKPLIQRDLDGLWSYWRRGKHPHFLDFAPSMGIARPFQKQIILGVVATRETKQWPLSFFAEVARHFARDFPEWRILIPLSSSATDQALREELKVHGLPPGAHFLETSLRQLPQALAGSQLYLGNDTGLKHLAVAMGIPTLTLFGPEPPLEWHPYDFATHPYFYLDPLECRTQVAHYCPLSHCESMICLKHWGPEEVYQRLRAML